MIQTDSFVSHSAEETEQWGRRFAHVLKSGDFVALYGDLGAGKTALVRGIASELGDEYVSSPTFSIVHEYQTQPAIYHFDIYRLQGEDDLEAIGYEDYLAAGGIILMEWPERAESALPDDRWVIRIEATGADERLISVAAFGNAKMGLDQVGTW